MIIVKNAIQQNLDIKMLINVVAKQDMQMMGFLSYVICKTVIILGIIIINYNLNFLSETCSGQASNECLTCS